MFLRRNNKLEALIGVNTDFKGDIVTGGTLRVDGKIAGNVVADWVVLGEAGSVRGDIKAKGVVIGGRVDGNINADELVDIKHTGSLIGDIHTRKLSVAEGGVFEGRSLVQKDDELKVIDFPAKEAIS
ncbi:MAG: polymer-forming cytoskeletal protein [Nitrospirae bacterium]|nr:MAG: polymer-forming cytoskeletal protein [Nitrospirota bacterium]